MEKLIEDIDLLLAMRRATKGEDEKAVIDRAIIALIAEKSRNSSPFYTPPSYIPPAPIWTTTPVLCKVQ